MTATSQSIQILNALKAGQHITPIDAPFFPVAIVRDDLATLETAADRHERLAAAAKAAPRGERLRLQHMTRAACLERLRAELDVMQ